MIEVRECCSQTSLFPKNGLSSSGFSLDCRENAMLQRSTFCKKRGSVAPKISLDCRAFLEGEPTQSGLKNNGLKWEPLWYFHFFKKLPAQTSTFYYCWKDRLPNVAKSRVLVALLYVVALLWNPQGKEIKITVCSHCEKLSSALQALDVLRRSRLLCAQLCPTVRRWTFCNTCSKHWRRRMQKHGGCKKHCWSKLGGVLNRQRAVQWPGLLARLA